jgi:hypothetical protein
VPKYFLLIFTTKNFYRQGAKNAKKGLKNNSKNNQEKPALLLIENRLATSNALLFSWRSWRLGG